MPAYPIENDPTLVRKSPGAEHPEFNDAAAAGDWGNYRRRCLFIDRSKSMDQSAALDLKRRFARAYLGMRAQAAGGVYMRTRASVLTPAYLEELAGKNMTARFARYPWLERLIQLLLQLEQDQYSYQSEPASMEATTRPRQRLQVVPPRFA